MKKIIVVVVCVFLAVLLLAPVYGGKKAQGTLTDLVAHINRSASNSAEWASYDQGWFASEAVLKINLSTYMGLPEVDGEDALIIPLQLDLHHGPVIIDGGFELGWFSGRWYLDDEHEAWLAENIQVEGEGPFFISTFAMALTGIITFYEQTLPFSLATNGGVFSIDGYAGQGLYRPFGALTYQGGFASASILSGDGNMLFEGFEVDVISELHDRVGAFAVPGEARFNLQKVAMINDNDSTFVIEDLAFSSAFAITQRDPDAGDVSMKVALGYANVLGETITDAVADIVLQRMSLTFYNQYMQHMQTTSNPQLLGLQLLSLANKELLPLGPELVIKQMGFSAPEGQLLINGHVRIPEGVIQNQASPLTLINHIEAKLTIWVDKPLAYKLAEQSAAKNVDEEVFASGDVLGKAERDATIKDRAAMQLDMLLLQNFIVDKGDQFETHMSLANGEAVINQQTLPLPF